VSARRLRVVAGGALLLLAAACNQVKNNNPPMPPPMTGAGGGGTVVHPPASGDVSVTIISPMVDPANPPQYGIGSLLPVSAQVQIVNGSDFVDASMVKMTVTAQNGSQVVANGQLILSTDITMPDVYTGRISLGDLPSGTYTLKVTAVSSGGAKGDDSFDFEIDAGPTVVVNTPEMGKSYKRGITIEVVAKDAFGLVGPPTATVGDIPVTMTAVAGVMDTFRGTIDFDMPMLPNGTLEPALFGDQLLTVVATNINGRRTEVQVIFTIDNEGPTITKTNPAPGQIVGGIVEISATLQDNAGILDASVIAVISDDTDTTKTPLFEIQLKPLGAGVYGALFDSSLLTQCPDPPAPGLCLVFPTISFRASDLLDNETSLGYGFAVDNIAPVADLDPPNLRDMKISGQLRCSHEFDPLGNDDFNGDMPNDGKMVPQVFDLRARIEDDGNHAAGLKLPPISLVNPTLTNVYVLDARRIAANQGVLIVDTDGDGACDSINPLLVPTTEPPIDNTQVLKVKLSPVKKQGSGDFTPDATLPLPYCANGTDAQPPDLLCTFLQPRIAISYAFGQPAIWSVDPIDTIHCQGGQFDTYANNISEGWACIAVGTTDQVGNFSVSAPLRVYVSYNYDSGARPTLGTSFGADPPAGAGPPPDCTGSYDKISKVVTPGACTTRKFTRNLGTGDGYTCYLGDCDGPL
jgi:hypothetical protein